MKTLILYATKHGCTATAAQRLAERLEGEVCVRNVKSDEPADPEAYDLVVLGGSIHAGSIQKSITKLCDKYGDTLLSKRLGLFICCMYEGEKAQEQLAGAFPKELRDHASAVGIFGGGFDFEKMNFFERAIVKKVADVSHSVSNLKTDEISRFADSMLA